MNTADKLMKIAIDGDPGEEVTVEREADAPAEPAEDEVVEETTLTRRVRRNPPPPEPEDRVIVIDD
jgi:hypothetical protein